MVITHLHCLGSGCHFAMVSLYCRHCQNYKQGVKKKNMRFGVFLKINLLSKLFCDLKIKVPVWQGILSPNTANCVQPSSDGALF